MRFAPHEHLTRWQARVLPVVTRMAMRGRAPDSDELDKTVALILVMERGAPECFAAENRHRSHHLPDCPWAPRNRGPRPSPEQAAATKAAVASYRYAGMVSYFDGPYQAAVNRRFTGQGAGPAPAAD